MFNRHAPYNTLPLLPLSQELESKEVLKLVIAARAALAELSGHAQRLPNPALLLDSLLLQEAKVSTEIENIVTTQDAIYQALNLPNEDRMPQEVKEVFRYREALLTGMQSLQERPLSTNSFIQIQNILKNTTEGIRRHSGTQLRNPSTGEVVYTPPDGENRIRDYLYNLEQFFHDPNIEMDPLIKMAIGHYQFEAIHPFTDGNGRTGRIINILYLIQSGLLQTPALYLSRYFLAHKSDYYRLLRRCTEEGAYAEWVAYVVEAVKESSIQSLHLINQICQLMEESQNQISITSGRKYLKDIIDLIFSRPYCKISHLEDKISVSRLTAMNYLDKLAHDNILMKVKIGRDNYYINSRLLQILQQ